MRKKKKGLGFLITTITLSSLIQETGFHIMYIVVFSSKKLEIFKKSSF